METQQRMAIMTNENVVSLIREDVEDRYINVVERLVEVIITPDPRLDDLRERWLTSFKLGHEPTYVEASNEILRYKIEKLIRFTEQLAIAKGLAVAKANQQGETTPNGETSTTTRTGTDIATTNGETCTSIGASTDNATTAATPSPADGKEV